MSLTSLHPRQSPLNIRRFRSRPIQYPDFSEIRYISTTTTGDTLVELVLGEEVEELGEDGETFVHKVEKRRNAGSHPQRNVAKLKSK